MSDSVAGIDVDRIVGRVDEEASEACLDRSDVDDRSRRAIHSIGPALIALRSCGRARRIAGVDNRTSCVRQISQHRAAVKRQRSEIRTERPRSRADLTVVVAVDESSRPRAISNKVAACGIEAALNIGIGPG